MQTFKNILFVTDFSEGVISALAKTLELANHYGARVTVMDVIPDYTGQFLYPEMEGGVSALREAMTLDSDKQITELLKKVRKKLSRQARKVEISTLIKEGTDYLEIIRQVQSGKYDLVAKAANKNKGLAARLFGTLDMQLFRKCPCPVLVIKPRKKIEHSKVLAAVDLNRMTKARSNLDQVIMDVASSLSGMEDGTLDIIHAWHLPYEKKLKNEERLSLSASLESMNRELRAAEKRHLQELADDFALFTPLTHLKKGVPEKIIPKFADTHGIDLVVMGTVGRTGVEGFFVGNTAEKILHALNCSVLAIKPDGYETPVKPAKPLKAVKAKPASKPKQPKAKKAPKVAKVAKAPKVAKVPKVAKAPTVPEVPTEPKQ